MVLSPSKLLLQHCLPFHLPQTKQQAFRAIENVICIYQESKKESNSYQHYLIFYNRSNTKHGGANFYLHEQFQNTRVVIQQIYTIYI